MRVHGRPRATPLREREGLISICYLFLGFFVETFLPRLPTKYENLPGVLSGRSSVFMAPYHEVLAVPQILRLLQRGLDKHDSGLSKVS